MTKVEKLTESFLRILDDIFLAVANDEIAPSAEIFKAAAQAKSILGKKINGVKSVRVSRKKLPNMLEHALGVVRYIFQDNSSFSEACKKQAEEAGGITIPSVRQACCRAPGLNTELWNKMANGDATATRSILNKLVSHYPYQKQEIKEAFKIR